MLFTNESTDTPTFRADTIRDRLMRRVSGLNLQRFKPMVRPAIGVAAYLTLSLLFHVIAPDFHLLPQEWSWNLAGGLSFGFLIAFGVTYTPVVFFAYLIGLFADGTTSANLWPVIAFAAGNTAVFSFASYIARRVVTTADVDLEDRKTLVVILALIPFTAVLAAFVSIMNWWFVGTLLPSTFVETFLIKTIGNGMGLLLVGPFVLLNGVPILDKLVLRSDALAMDVTAELVQGAALLHAAAGAIVVIGVVGLDQFQAYLLLFVPLVIMGLKFGLRGVAASFLVVGGTRMAMALLGYTGLDGPLMETTILAALLSNLIVATLATERTRALTTVRKQADLIVDVVVRTKQETLGTPEHEDDLKAVLKHLVTEVDAAAHLYGIEDESGDDQAEHERLLERLGQLIDDGDRATDADAPATVGERHGTSLGEGERVGDSHKDEIISAPLLS